MPATWNLFLIGRTRDDEDQLTEMLVWLAGLVPAVRDALLRLAFGEAGPDGQEVEATTQHGIVGGRLDAFFQSHQVALIIESKLGSSYGPGQIRKYLEWLADEFEERPARGVLTLTARESPWHSDDLAYAGKRGLVASARRWEELHSVLEPAASADDDNDLSARLVREFLEMLASEGLIPIKPLSQEDLGPRWADAWTAVRRYGDFFDACKGRIADALGAQALSNSWSPRGDWFWQDYAFDGGSRLVVGLLCTDEHEQIPTHAHTRTPIVWLAASAEHLSEWADVAKYLEAHPPDGWTTGRRWYGKRPNVWRPLPSLLAGQTFEDQREALVSAVSVAAAWIAEATAASDKSP